MASKRIAGITIEIDGDTTKLNKALQGVDGQIKTTKGYLADVDKLLKLDPSNVELLKQKEKYLNDEIKATQDRLKELKTISKDSLTTDQWDAVQREISETESNLNALETEYKDFGSVAKQELKAVADKMNEIGSNVAGTGDKMTMYLTTPIVGLATGAVKTAADFETSLAKVQAVSGASAEEMAVLKERAAELGENTKFSASEVADAFNYMAMAGWDVDKMLGGIEGVLSLSAADGLDLATTSDIVTDAMTAFGMSADEAGHFADVLATASSSANTNVAMLGESFKYVAPVAGALGYSAEDVAIALGLMANSGIKASSAGTALRTMLVNLSKPTEQMKTYMDKLGISLTDQDGNLYSLADLMGNLREGMAVTTDEQIALNYVSNQSEELMGALADGWENMTDQEQKYNTELSVGTEILEGMSEAELKQAAAERLGISLGKERRLTAEEYNELAQVLGQDTLTGLAQSEQAAAAAAIFGKNAMAGGLAIVNASTEDYGNLSDAIYNSEGAAQKMADIMSGTLTGNITQLQSKVEGLGIAFGDLLIPKVSECVDWLKDAADWVLSLDGDTKDMIVTVGLVVAAAGPLLSVGGRLIEGMGLIMAHPLIAGGILLGGVLAAAIYDAYRNTESWADADWEVSDSLKDLLDSIERDTKAIEDAKDARNKNIEAIESEWGHVKDLKTELDGLVDENGKVKKGYEDRARFIIGELTEATGVELEMIDGVIQGYSDISAEIDKVIETRRNAAILNAYEAEYQQALKNVKRAQDNLNTAVSAGQAASDKYNAQRQKVLDIEAALEIAQRDGADIQAELNALGEAGKRIWEEYYEEGDTGYELTKKLKAAWDDEAGALDLLEDEYVKSQQAIDEANDAYLNYQWTIDRYEGASVAAIANDADGVKRELDGLQEGYTKTADEHERQLQRQVEDANRIYADLKQAAADGNKEVTDQMIADANAQRLQAEKDLAKYRDSVTNGYRDVVTQSEKILKDGKTKYENAAQEGMDAIEQKIRQGHGPQDATAAMVEAMDGELNKGKARAEAQGKSVPGEYGSGINQTASAANTAASGVVNQADSGLNTGKAKANAQGQSFTGEYASGVVSTKYLAYNGGAGLGQSATQGANDNNGGHEAGSELGSGYHNGILGWFTTVWNDGWALADKAINAAKTRQASGSPSRVMMEAGNEFGEGYEIGINEQADSVQKAAEAMVDDAVSAADRLPDINSLYASSPGGGFGALNGTTNNNNQTYSFGAPVINVYANEGMNVNDLAEAIEDRLASLQKQREVAYV